MSISFMYGFDAYSTEELRYMSIQSAAFMNTKANGQPILQNWISASPPPFAAIAYFIVKGHLWNQTRMKSSTAVDPSSMESQLRASILAEGLDRAVDILFGFYKQTKNMEEDGNFPMQNANSSLLQIDQVSESSLAWIQPDLDRISQLLPPFRDTVTESLVRRRASCSPLRVMDGASAEDREMMIWNGAMPDTCLSYDAIPVSLRKNLETGVDQLSHEFSNAASSDNADESLTPMWRHLLDPNLYMCVADATTYIPRFAIDRQYDPSLEVRVHRITGRAGLLANHTERGWIPVDVKFDSQGRAELLNYVNNLHPRLHRGLDVSIAEAITSSRPLFDRVLSSLAGPCPSLEFPLPDQLSPSPSVSNPSSTVPSSVSKPHVWSLLGRTVQMVIAIDEVCVDASDSSRYRRRLTPECQRLPLVTGVYVLEATNLHEITISFMPIDPVLHQEPKAPRHLFAPQKGWAECCFAFPTNCGYYIDPLQLIDESKPGRLRIVTIHLMDPHVPVLSSTEIPMQQPAWIREATVIPVALAKGLPRGVECCIQDFVGGGLTSDVVKAARQECYQNPVGSDLPYFLL